jgi:hypothetical protein
MTKIKLSYDLYIPKELSVVKPKRMFPPPLKERIIPKLTALAVSVADYSPCYCARRARANGVDCCGLCIAFAVSRKGRS